MKFERVESFSDLLEQTRPDFPTVIVAGWMRQDGEICGANVVKTNVVPSCGQMAVGLAACMAALFEQIERLIDEHPESRESIEMMIDQLCGKFEFIRFIRNDLSTINGSKATGA